ncbi:putative MFS family arabinose efflux permease [Kribbella amoyensis]|uniref:Putative MFS family arabinose efflux permease n=1 Tax=Kribbella amoyensis TaxID=996641 RepID=A0A561B8E8_9ACTN|nr:MFS transporter [Kribbella amoyensis]TWD75069.1 putative MFS family arabinose efflux permease [Kribbella amoyensis]
MALSESTAPPLPRTPLRAWAAVCSVTLGIFTIVTAEILPIGLLPLIGDDFALTPGRTGWLMTIPGLVAAVAAPIVTVTTRRLDRRSMLAALLAVLALSDALAAAAEAYWLELAARVLVGLVIGGFWSIGAGLAVRLVPPHAVARATAMIFAAVPLGSVLGVPAGTLLGEAAGWRTAFATLGLLTLVSFGALLVLAPPLPPVDVTRLGVLRDVLRKRQTKQAMVVTAMIVLAHFGTYTYVTPLLLDVTGVASEQVGVLLLVYGVAGFAGNALAGAGISRDLRATFVAACGLLAVATVLLPIVGRSTPLAVGLLVVWGLAYGAVPACSMSLFARVAPQAREAMTVVFTSTFQAMLSTGALLGGLVVDLVSVPAVMICGGLLAAAALTALLRWER